MLNPTDLDLDNHREISNQCETDFDYEDDIAPKDGVWYDSREEKVSDIFKPDFSRYVTYNRIPENVLSQAASFFPQPKQIKWGYTQHTAGQMMMTQIPSVNNMSTQI